jgi:hypothetical protein
MTVADLAVYLSQTTRKDAVEDVLGVHRRQDVYACGLLLLA